MSNTRREFLQSSAAVAVGLMGGTARILEAETLKSAQAASQSTAARHRAAQLMVQVPTMKLGGVDISRMVMGVNPLYGFAHYNLNFASSMAEWYTQERVCEVLHRANSYGINAFNYVNMGRAPKDLALFSVRRGQDAPDHPGDGP